MFSSSKPNTKIKPAKPTNRGKLTYIEISIGYIITTANQNSITTPLYTFSKLYALKFYVLKIFRYKPESEYTLRNLARFYALEFSLCQSLQNLIS